MARKPATKPPVAQAYPQGVGRGCNAAETPAATTTLPSLPRGADQDGGSPPASPPQIEPAYQVVSPLRHNGRRYQPGELLTDIAPPLAARLLGLRVIEIVE